MTLQALTDRIVRGLPGMGAAAVLVLVVVGISSGLSPGDAPDRTAALATEDPVQEAVLYGAVISALGDREIRGYAVVLPSEDGGAEVMVDVHGVEPSVEHMQHIHSGTTCSNIGGVVQPLEPYPQADGDGAVHYRETFDSLPDNITDHIIVIHGADGAPVACGALEGVRE